MKKRNQQTGNFFNYYHKTNYDLTESQKKNRLDHHQQEPINPYKWDNNGVIHLNDTYLELTEFHYLHRGGWTFFAIFLFLVCFIPWSKIVFMYIWDAKYHNVDAFLGLIGISIISLAILIPCLWVLSKETFSLTHYPIRFNRKTRKVHLFTDKGEVVSHHWDDLCFVLDRANVLGSQQSELRILALAEDKETVIGAGALSIGSKTEMLRYWEFIRSYMNNGPESIINDVTLYLPISQKRERPWFSFFRKCSVDAAYSGFFVIIVIPAALMLGAGRIISMWTSRIPCWPKEVEDDCEISANDPYDAIEKSAVKFSLMWLRPKYHPIRQRIITINNQKTAKAQSRIKKENKTENGQD